jgi:hypothetical protein
MTMRRQIAAALAATAAVVGTGAALAATAPDPADAGEKLDLKSVRAAVSGGKLRLTVGTYGAVKPADLAGTLSNLFVLIDSNEDGKTDYKAQILSKNGQPLVAMVSGHGKHLEPIPVKGSGGRLSVTLPADTLAVAGKKLRIAATSKYQACACQSKHVDRAPNSGWVTAG